MTPSSNLCDDSGLRGLPVLELWLQASMPCIHGESWYLQLRNQRGCQQLGSLHRVAYL
jgi:hypothetical protein